MAQNPVSDLEACDVWSNGGDGAGNVLTENGRVVKREPSEGLYCAVDGVYGEGVVLD